MLSLLEKIASSFWEYISRVLSLITPFGRGREFFRIGPGLRAFLHILIVVGVLVGLYWVNNFFNIDKALKAPRFAPALRFFWLPILFLLMYTMVWLGWWLWKLLGPEEYTTEFPDIDAAWEEAIKTLNESKIELTDAPLFLVLGRTAGGEETLFTAAQLNPPLTVKFAPRRNDAPLHFFANRDGIYLTCAGASLIGKQAELLSGGGGSGEPASGGSSNGADSGEDPLDKTLRPTGKLEDVRAVLRRAKEQGRELTDSEKGEIRNLMSAEEAEKARRAPATLLKNASEIERLAARFKHLCRLILRDRRPYCPINGIMLLVPFGATERDEDASQAGSLIQQELALVRSTLRVRCPVLTVVCDLELAPGFREFIERFPSDQRQRRLGQRFPLVPDLDSDRMPGMFEGGVDWMAQAMFPNWIYKLFRLESSEKDDVNGVIDGNARLYQLMQALSERKNRLGRMLVRGLIADNGGPPLCSGCYVTASGREAAREQAFVAGVFRRLPENQDFVSWTDDALRDDTESHKWANYGYIGVSVAALLLLAVGVVVWMKNK